MSSGRRYALVSGAALAGAAGALVAASSALTAVADGARPAMSVPWLPAGGVTFAFAVRIDPLAAIMVTLVSAVAVAVFAFAVSYMRGDRRYGRFFAVLSLFAGAMLALVVADDVVFLFAMWELVGLCSFLLIGHWFEQPGVGRAATQAFIVTRIGDMALLAGLLLLVRETGTTSISAMVSIAESGPGAQMQPNDFTLIAALLFLGAMGKSAQLPLQGWLPDAMAGPTPVSALIHSATMVAAGVYLVARFYPLFDASGVLSTMAWIGAATAVYGGIAALAQSDLKRLLAYSTMSQLGLMFVGIGAGSLTAGLLLLVGQGLFKSLLFLAAGSVGHAVHTTELAAMGGLRQRMPVTFGLFAFGAAALAGIPITLAWPVKDAVLAAALEQSLLLFVVALLASLLTALYATRAVILTFLGAPRSGAAREAQESPWRILAPMVMIALLLFGAAAVDSPLIGRPLEHLLAEATPEVPLATVLALITAAFGVGVGLVAGGKSSKTSLWPRLQRMGPLAQDGLGFPRLYCAVERHAISAAARVRAFDLRVFDSFGDAVVRRVSRAVAWARITDLRIFDRAASVAAAGVTRAVAGARMTDLRVFDRAANLAAAWTLTVVRTSRRVDVHRIDASFDAAGGALLEVGQRLRASQTGRVYNYFAAVFTWVAGVIFIALAMILLRAVR